MIDTPTPALNLAPKALNTKAMLVKLTTSKPRMSLRNVTAETYTRDQLGDATLMVSTKLFADKANPIRVLLNAAGEIYTYHTANTLPWTDRGPRLLPVDKYEDYSAQMRKLVGFVESMTHKVLPDYDAHVAADIAARNAKPPKPGAPACIADIADYETRPDFERKLKFEFRFSPLPDTSHYLFDISEDDKATLNDQLAEAVEAAHADMAARIHDPLAHFIKKLSVPIGSDGAIFRDTAFTNIVESLELVESLAMGDDSVLNMVADVRKAIRPMALAPNVLRESPVERKAAAEKLAEVANKLGFLFNN